ncbi:MULTISPECIES: GNAT family N-acetyltransferase [Streptomyces]|uniref:GNAT family N-acetyltransferase n=1 Tax=Streptomyces TaxID=1883 RepID=UPI000A37B98A|nr:MULTISPECIES: GNAT family N-acetyltransferase [Streptomyces]MDX3617762.1 GNAT family N-acetyltransferase [Streptomyces europaeiscabiei]MDX3636452.1 GNAT family N-acetyltransferase [Streptomyces europaeiscabiei]MDX3654453.1 GNAT family N-acetyltransferase [Streptomyces europaeiscabiei]
MTVNVLTISSYTSGRLAEIREALLDVYADVYEADIATDPFFSMERFEERLEGHVAAGGWGCVVAEVGGAVAGFTYGFTARDDVTTFKLCENMLREQWRKRGISRVMHDELVSRRQEEHAELLVRRERPRLRAMYENWGYEHAGEKLPFSDAPLYDVMVLALR